MSDILTPKERKEYIVLAQALFYDEDIIERLKRAKSHTQAQNILHDGRNHEGRNDVWEKGKP